MDLFYTACFIVLLQFISVKSDGVAQSREQECFSKAYQCTEHRVQFTASSSLQLETNPENFAELCRRNKDFSDCIENAADFCSNHHGSMYDIANMFIENRRHIKTFCTNEEWQIKYFASATCINEYTDLVENDCADGPKEKNRDYKANDPCKEHIPYISCKIKKIKLLCGITAGEVYRRLNIGLDGIFGPWDVKCEFYRRIVKNTLDQDNLFSLEDQPNIVKRIGPRSQTVSESINKNIESMVIDKLIDLFSHLTVEEINNLFNPEDMLRKFLFKRENKNMHSIFASDKISENESFLMPDIWSECLNLFSEKVKRILLDSNIEGSKLIAHIFENLLKDSCKSKKLAMKICFEKIKELIVRAKHSKKVFDDLKVLNDFILGIFERLSSRELELSNPSESFTLVSTDIVRGFPLKSLNCTWSEEATRQTFHCTLKLNSSLYTTKEIETVTSDISNAREHAPEHMVLNSEFTECGKSIYSNIKPFTLLQDTEFETFKQENINFADNDASNDVHRIGYKIKESKKVDYPDLFNSDPKKNKDIPFTKIANPEQSEQNKYKAELNTPDFIEPKPLDSVKDGDVFSPKMKHLGHFEETKYNGKPYKPEFPEIKSVRDENEVFLLKMADLKQSGKTEYTELYKPDFIEPKYLDSVKDGELTLKIKDLEYLEEIKYNEPYKPELANVKTSDNEVKEVYPTKINFEHLKETRYNNRYKPEFVELTTDKYKFKNLPPIEMTDFEHPGEREYNELKEFLGMIKSDVFDNEEVSIMEKSDIESTLEEYPYATADTQFIQTEHTNLKNKKSLFNSGVPTSRKNIEANTFFKVFSDMLDELSEQYKIDLDRTTTIEENVKFLCLKLETFLRKVAVLYPADVSDPAKSNVGKFKKTTDKFEFEKLPPIEMTDFEHPGERQYNKPKEFVGMIKSDVFDNEEVSIMGKTDIEASFEEYPFVKADTPFIQTEQAKLENKKSLFNSRVPTSRKNIEANAFFNVLFEMLDKFSEEYKIDLDKTTTFEVNVKFLCLKLQTFLRKVAVLYPVDVSEAAKSNVGKLKKSEEPSKPHGPDRSHEPVQSNFNYHHPVDEL